LVKYCLHLYLKEKLTDTIKIFAFSLP
jgi:hypothetical protein